MADPFAVPKTDRLSDIGNVLKDDGSGKSKAQELEGVSLEAFISSLSASAVAFGVQLIIFAILRRKLHRIYEPRTYLVPEKRRTNAPSKGIFSWIKPIFTTSTSEFIEKSGLDAYFFLRYLYLLLRIFLLIAIPVLPILLPLNAIGGLGYTVDPPVKGMDRLGWTNISPSNTRRYWAHLIFAVYVINVCCYMFYRELRVYIRLRQAWLTSPQHRLRASATTVLVSSIPRRWLSMEALLELYDVFPGGIRNIWINRDFDELAEKVKLRNKYAAILELAETELIIMAKKKHLKQLAKERKKNKDAPPPETEVLEPDAGLSAGNPHQVDETGRDARDRRRGIKRLVPIPIVGDGLDYVVSGVSRAANGVTTGVTRVAGVVIEKVDDLAAIPDSSFRPDEDDQAEAGVGAPRQGLGSPAPQRPTYEHHASSGKSAGSNPRRGSTLFPTKSAISQGSQPSTRGLTLQRTISQNPDDKKPAESARPPAIRTLTKKNKPPKTLAQRLMFWNKSNEEDERPITVQSPNSIVDEKRPDDDKEEYPEAFDTEYDNDANGESEPVWKKYLTEKDRPTMRRPLMGKSWFPSMPLIGKKVDTIYFCRKEVARLNVEIEKDQQEPEKFPMMNSAFIQFNNQVAAHMACQSLNHHSPENMGPRHIEVSPDDVVWDNLRVKWWEKYLRTAMVTGMVGGLIIGWAFPVAFVGLVSQIKYLTFIPWLRWLEDLPEWILGAIQGVLPPIGLAILMALLPIILRLFARIQGRHTGMAMEQAVQGMYFAFLFIQVFLVVSISSAITVVIKKIAENPTSVPEILATNLPKAGNFFFSYLLLQAFAVSGGALLQIGSLLVYYIIGPLLDTTAREKWARQTDLIEIKWGTFYPVYTNFGCIGIIYSVISPIILVFNLFTFSLFWVVYRYNLLFVNNFRFDNGGILFPTAVNQLFTGLYVMEVCLIGLFFLVRDTQQTVACFPQAIIMVIFAIFTVIFQYMLNKSIGPLLTYLPITLEDDAARRDEEFARARDAEHRRLRLADDEEEEGKDINTVLRDRERREREADNKMEQMELDDIRNRKSQGRYSHPTTSNLFHTIRRHATQKVNNPKSRKPGKHQSTPSQDLEAAVREVERRREVALFDHLADEIEDLSPEERDHLVARAFQHEALRAKRPVIWIPRDDLGISDDEIYRTMKFSKHIWISNEYAGLDKKGKVIYRRSPPDFDVRDLIEL